MLFVFFNVDLVVNVVYTVLPSGVTDVKIMSKREVRELGCVEENQICPMEIRIVEVNE